MSRRGVSTSILQPVVAGILLALAGCSDSKPATSASQGSDSCEEAPLLALTSGAAVAHGTIAPGDEGARAACGLASGSDVFFRVRLDQESQLTFIVAGDEAASAVLLPDGCNASVALAGCGASDSLTLAAGSYLLAVIGKPGTTFTLEVAAGAPAPMPDEVAPGASCDTPPTLSLVDGAVSVGGELPAGAGGGGLCSSGAGGEPTTDVFYRVNLTDPAELGVVVTSDSDVRASVVPEACPPAGETAACAATSTMALDPGSYLVAVSGAPAATFALTLVAVPKIYTVGSDSCDAPPALSLATGSAHVSGTIPAGDDGLASACGTGPGSDVFFRVRTAVETDLSYILDGDPGVHAALLDDTCPIGTPLDVCATAGSSHVSAGTHLVGVYGPVGAAYDLTVAVADVDPPPPPSGTCSIPLSVPLASGTNVLTGTFENALDNGKGSCRYSATPDVVYELTLLEAADLALDSNTSYYLRRGDCEAGAEIACEYYEATRLVNLEPGTYYLFVEEEYSTQYSISISLLPPTLRPANDTCTGALPLDLSSGAASATGSFLAAVPESTSSCSGQRGLYYSFSLASPAAVQLATNSSYVSMQLMTGACPSPSSLLCDTSYTTRCTDVLPAGDYLVRISEDWPVSTPVTLTVSVLPAVVPPPNDACADAAAMALVGGSGTVSGTLAGADDSMVLSGSNCTVGSESGQDVFYRVALAERSDLTVSLSGSSALQVGVVTSGCGSPATVACTWYTGTKLFGVPAGDLLLVVERKQSSPPYNDCPSASDAFTLSLGVTPSPPAPANDTCGGASPLAVATVGTALSEAATTRGAGSDIDSVLCPGSSYNKVVAGGDVVYSLELTEPGRIRVTPTTSFSGMTMYLLGGSCPLSAAMACSDSYSTALDTGFVLMPGTYYLVVDATGTTPGDFSFVIEHLAQ